MKAFKLKTLAAIAFLSVAVASCKKDDDPVTPTTTPAEVGFTFKNVVGIDPLILGTNNQYFNASNEQFQVTTFNYYISNIKLIKKDGSTYAEPESYHLVKESEAGSKHFHIQDVPFGEYTGVTFMIGVDEARNTSGAQTGALDPINDMFWTWQSGYIMAKMEGLSSSSTQPDHKFRYHIGGFNGDNSGVRTVTLTFANNMVLASGASGEIELKADAGKWFAPNNVSIAAVNEIMSVGPTSKKIADNYANMFSITSTSVVIE